MSKNFKLILVLNSVFCIYFIVHRILNFDMSFEHLIEDIFNYDPNTNETLVTNFAKNYSMTMKIYLINVFADGQFTDVEDSRSGTRHTKV